MQLIDKGNYFALGFLNFFQNCLESFFKFSAELTSRNHRTKVERYECLSFETLWHIACDDALSEAFNYGGLSNTGFTNQHWVVLGSSG